MKLIAQRRFQDGDKEIEIGQAIEVTEARGKELLAIGQLVATPEALAAAAAEKEGDESRTNINEAVDGAAGALPVAPVNPPNHKPGHDRKKKPAAGPTETKATVTVTDDATETK